ncbi:hypothetical protein ACR78F_10560, partial [Sphingobacterium spiritivorum]
MAQALAQRCLCLILCIMKSVIPGFRFGSASGLGLTSGLVSGITFLKTKKPLSVSRKGFRLKKGTDLLSHLLRQYHRL